MPKNYLLVTAFVLCLICLLNVTGCTTSKCVRTEKQWVERERCLAYATTKRGSTVCSLIEKYRQLENVCVEYEDGSTGSGLFGRRENVKSQAPTAKPSKVENALCNAAERGDLHEVTRLIDSGSDVNVKTDAGGTALHLASLYGHLEIVLTLLDRGADVNTKTNSGYTALHLASRYGYVEIVQTLLAKGSDVNAMGDGNDTALHLASQYGYVEIVQTLIANGADVNAKTNSGATALSMSQAKGKIEVSQQLIKAGAK